MILLLPFGVVLLAVLSVASQSIPSSWNSTLTTSNAERVDIARGALEFAIAQLGTDGMLDTEIFSLTGNLYSQMAEFDIATNQTNNYKNTLEQYFAMVESTRPNFTDSATYGYAAAKAYTAYKDPSFLQYAVQSWWVGRSRTISQDDLSAGKIAGKNFTLRKVCRNATMVGGTFQFNTTEDPTIEGFTTGLFLVLSALLAEATPDPAYLQAANESANFLHSNLFDPRNIVQSFIFGNDTSDPTCGVGSNEDPDESGVMIEGLSILSSISKSDSTQNLLSDMLLASIFNRIWQGDNGIVSYSNDVVAGGKTGSLNLLLGLGSAYTRQSINSTLRQHVGEYITVQFNAVIGLATVDGTDIYGQSWTGPPNSSFSGFNQITALGALISAIGLETVTSSLPIVTPSTSPSKSNHTPAIVGGTVGGIIFLACILAILWLLRIQRSSGSVTPHAGLEPFFSSLQYGGITTKGEAWRQSDSSATFCHNHAS
ncbi:hypothetical protein C8R45DRAFT_1213164 [Mycena sanguinolenta]|nr:hypothetical protein C8R45DRAFT_1213164 [Mycena sanguinolenta]